VWTGFAGLAAATIAIIVIADWLQPTWLKTLIVLGAGAAAMVVVDLAVFRVGRNAGTGLAQEPLRPPDIRRVGLKLAGLWATVALVAAVYALAIEYTAELYASFKSAALWALPGFILASPLYVAYVDRRQREPNDSYAQLGQLLFGQRPEKWDDLRLHALAWLVKGFFLPLMFAMTHDNLVVLWARTEIPSPLTFEPFFGFALEVMYLFDVLLASIAYTLTFRLLDSHIRSVEPTLAGWAVCLVCYQPFVYGTLHAYLDYDTDGLFWGSVFAPYPVLYVLWGSAIVLLIAVYLMATVAFGLRFSNLTNRGIITSGPYRWLKHPAYVSKNLSWWLISVPFVAGAGWQVAVQSCLLLLGVNFVYYLRARTEERHLRADPVYREYEAFMAEHGLLAVVKRWFIRPRRPRRDAAEATPLKSRLQENAGDPARNRTWDQ
jgi:protein-S-isoprenylcysteine O-methyltransferase Ste14